MSTQYSQIKINVPLSVKKKLQNKCRKYGITMAFYIKYLIIKDMEDNEVRKTLKSDKI